MSSEITIYSAPTCAFCHSMIQSLEQLKSTGKIHSFSIIDVSKQSKEVEKLSIRSVPYLVIKNRVYIGKMTIAEIAHWYSKENTEQGHSDYFKWQLNKGELIATESTLTLNPRLLRNVIQLLLSSKTQLSVKIGLMALIENYENTDQLRNHFSLIKENISHEDYRIRTEVTELILLSHHTDAEQHLIDMSQDEHPEVSSAAQDALETLQETQFHSSNTQH